MNDSLWLHPTSRYGLCQPQQQGDGSYSLDPLSRPCLTADGKTNQNFSLRSQNLEAFEQPPLHITIQPGETPFALAQRIYGDARLFWVVCECLQVSHPFQQLPAQTTVPLISPDALQQVLDAGADLL